MADTQDTKTNAPHKPKPTAAVPEMTSPEVAAAVLAAAAEPGKTVELPNGLTLTTH